MKNKSKKIIIVIALTLVIWVWAYQASEKSLSVTAILDISRAIDESLLVTFDEEIRKEFEVEIAGPASKINDFKDKLAKGQEKLEFLFNAENESMDEPGTHKLDLLKFLKNSEKIASLELTVKSCGIETVDITVEKLVEQELTVECRDKNNFPLQHETIDPPSVKMFVHKDWVGDVMLKAYLVLNPQDADKARKSAIELTPYVKLLNGVVQRYADDPVKVKLLSTETPLENQKLTGSDLRIGYVFSNQARGEYDVELTNKKDLIRTTLFNATKEAIDAYKLQKYQILIFIRENDINQDDVNQGYILRDVVYNFPQKYVAKNEIYRSSNPQMATFKLVPISGTTVTD